MYRRYFLVTLLCVAPLNAQVIVDSYRYAAPAPSCTAPTGTNFTESFGDSSTSCWSGGPASCTGTWTVGAGTAHSIVSSPGTPPANAACAYSLQMAVPASTAYITRTFTGITGAF